MPSKSWHRQTENQKLEAEIERLNIRIQYLEMHQAQTPQDKSVAELRIENQAYRRYLSDTAVEFILRHWRQHGSPARRSAENAAAGDLAPKETP